MVVVAVQVAILARIRWQELQPVLYAHLDIFSFTLGKIIVQTVQLVNIQQ